jgi:hypothetical protein
MHTGESYTARHVCMLVPLNILLAAACISLQALELTRQLVNLINRTPGTASDSHTSAAATASRPGSANGAAAAAAAAPQAVRAMAAAPVAAPAGGVAAAAALGVVRGDFGGMAPFNPRFGAGVAVHPGIAGGVAV